MNFKKTVILSFLAGIHIYLLAQPVAVPSGNGSLSGKVIDAETNQPIEYANISIYKMPDSSLVTGTISNARGSFLIDNIPFGNYTVIVDFIGYKQTTFSGLSVTSNEPDLKLSDVNLNKAVYEMDEVQVKADAPRVQYKIDKKVINVSQDLTSASGTAVDALENVPSVKVDIEGNVTMRGSTNFNVLVDGKPTALDGSDALQQIPVARIKNIEIITNPSAKYDPEGTGGIINVIMKEQKYEGISGTFSAGAGLNDKYNTEATVSYKKGITKITGGFDFRDQNYYGEHTRERTTYDPDTTYHLFYDGNRYLYRGGISGNLGVELNISPKTNIGISGKYGVFRFGHGNDYKVQKDVSPGQTLFYKTESYEPFKRTYYVMDIDFDHHFTDKSHLLKGFIHWTDRWGDSKNSTAETITDKDWNTIPSKIDSIETIETENSNKFQFQLDYSNSFSENGKFDAGIQSKIDNDAEHYTFNEYSYALGWTTNNLYNNKMDYGRIIHAGYMTYSNSFRDIGMKGGLRIEYTNRTIDVFNPDTTYTLKRYDFFPTIHLNKELSGKHQLQLSYSRRINRPRGWYLEPFISYMDKDNIRQGNPELNPEYIDSYEVNWQKRWDGSFISIEGYYRYTDNLIERYAEYAGNNIVMHTFENVGNSYALGTELMINYRISKKIIANLTGNIYHYSIKGDLGSSLTENKSLNWDIRSNNSLDILKNTKIQLTLQYEGPTATSQGIRKGFFMANSGIRYDFRDSKASATLNIRDIFGTRTREFKKTTNVFKGHSKMKFESPIAIFSIKYFLNREKQKNNKPGNGHGDEGMEMY